MVQVASGKDDSAARSLFSPAGRRWPKGSDEGVREALIIGPPATPSSPRMRSALLPAGEKRERVAPPFLVFQVATHD
jgi:hypothetical protein